MCNLGSLIGEVMLNKLVFRPAVMYGEPTSTLYFTTGTVAFYEIPTVKPCLASTIITDYHSNLHTPPFPRTEIEIKSAIMERKNSWNFHHSIAAYKYIQELLLGSLLAELNILASYGDYDLRYSRKVLL